MRKIVFVFIILFLSLIGCASGNFINDSFDVNAVEYSPLVDTTESNEMETTDENPNTVEPTETPSFNKYTDLDDVSAEKMYFEAKRMLSYFVSGSVGCDYNDSIEVDEVIYYRVTEEKYSNYENFLSLFKNYFTDRYVDELFSDTLRFIEYEGKTYTDGGVQSSSIYVGDDKYLSFSEDEKQAEILISTEVLDDELSPSGSVEHAFRLKFEGGHWKFDIFYLTNYTTENHPSASAPQTGFATYVYAAAAVVAAAGAVTIVKRRRTFN